MPRLPNSSELISGTQEKSFARLSGNSSEVHLCECEACSKRLNGFSVDYKSHFSATHFKLYRDWVFAVQSKLISYNAIVMFIKEHHIPVALKNVYVFADNIICTFNKTAA